MPPRSTDCSEDAIWKSINKFITEFLILGDGSCIVCSWLLSYYLRFHAGVFPLPHGIPDFDYYLFTLPLVLLSWGIAASWLSLYRLKKDSPLYFVSFQSLQTHILMLLILSVFLLFFRIQPFNISRLFILLFGIINVFSFFLFRLALDRGMKFFFRKDHYFRQALIAGAEETGVSIARTMQAHPFSGYRIVGFVDDRKKKGEKVNDIPVLGRLGAIGAVVEKYAVQTVFVCLHLEEYRKIHTLMKSLSATAVNLRLVLNFSRYDLLFNSTISDLDGYPVINLLDSPIEGWNGVWKRIFDIAFSLLVVIGLFPLYVLIAVCVKLSSKGSVIYKQKRMGIDGEVFVMYKFRSMPVEAEAKVGPQWARKGESRATGFGKFLRRTSLDELPQFFNVIKGNMSVVGPRPERPVFIKQFKKKVPLYMLRHKMKAGITGWAQINGWRGNTSLEERIRHDLYYIHHWSMLLDMKIILITLYKGFIHENAY